jgi:hypothetical protein
LVATFVAMGKGSTASGFVTMFDVMEEAVNNCGW